ncbi:MAG: DUF4190 domain-containing protein [Phycisphaeraceae bacterium]
MSSYPTPTQPPTTIGGYQPPPSNGLGIAGFVVSLTGLVVTGGFVCPLGVILSLVALRKQPRGFAVAGLITGLLGCALAALVVLAIAGVVGAGTAFMQGFSGQINTSMTMDSASWDIDSHFANNQNTLPDQATGDAIVGVYVDDWGTALRYEPLANSTQDYRLRSAGTDQQFNTLDDIVQPYTAGMTHGFAHANPAQPFGDEGPSDAQINHAFDQAARQIVTLYATDNALPDETAGNTTLQGVLDAWGTPFRYGKPPQDPTSYHLKSAGPDGQWLTKDDLTRTFYVSPGE